MSGKYGLGIVVGLDLFLSLRGTLSFPLIDPGENIHRVCEHHHLRRGGYEAD